MRGWIVLLFIGAALVALGVKKAHPFLTVNAPVPSDILVIEGSIPDSALKATLTELTRDHYRKVLVTGGPIGSGTYLCGYTNWADLGAATLLRLGVDTNTVEAVPAARLPGIARSRPPSRCMPGSAVITSTPRPSIS